MDQCFGKLKVISCCAEPSLSSGGTRARASSWRTGLGYVRCARREDLPHRCAHGGSGTSSAGFANSRLQMLAAPGIIVGVLGTYLSSTFLYVETSFKHQDTHVGFSIFQVTQ